MPLRTLFLIAAIALMAAFAAINWPAFAAATQLSLLVTSFEAPLGLLLLGLMMVVVLVFTAYMAAWQGRVLMDTRRHAKELEQQRVLADRAEASRFTELSGLLRTEVTQLTARLVQVQEALSHEIRDNGNALAANLGEMDDRLRRSGASQGPSA